MTETSDGSEERIAAWQQANGGVIVADQDIRAVIGVLAILEGEVSLGQLGEELAGRPADRLKREGAPPVPDLAAAFSGLNQRLRTARGEYSV